MKTLRDKRVLVIGGSRGLGLAIAERFAADGAELVLAGRDAVALENAMKSLESRGARCRVQTLDVTDPASLTAARERIHADAGRIDVLVNSAGVVHGGAFLDVPLEHHRATYDVNVQGLVAATHTFLPDLLEAEEGHVVNMASAAGLIGLPWGAVYASSKWAVIGLSHSLRMELAQLGQGHVGVTAVCASFADTGMFEGVRPPHLTRMLRPDKLAGKVHRAVLAGRPYVREPWLVKFTPLLMAALPTALSDRVSGLFGVTTGMKSWRGHGPPSV